MAKTIENLFFNLVYLFDFIVIAYCIFISFKRVDKRILWLLISYCSLNSLCNLGQTQLSTEYNYPILVFFTLSEFLLLSIFFSIFIQNKNFKKFIIIAFIAFSAFVIFNYNVANSHKIDSLPIGIETILILIYSFFYLFEQMNIVDETFIYSRAYFWMVIGMMVYLGGSFFIYIFANQVANTKELFELLDNYWFLTYVFYIIKNCFFIVGLFLYAKPKKKQSSILHRLSPI